MRLKTKSIKRYSTRFKQQVVVEYQTDTSSIREICKKYEISIASLTRWQNEFSTSSNIQQIDLPLGSMTILESMAKLEKKVPFELPSDVESLQALVRDLEAKLRISQMREEAANIIIDIAERDLDIQIRKKSDTKQSKQ